MGIYLSSPCREVDAEEGTGDNMQYAVGEMQVRDPSESLE